jgi:DedD protein
MDRRVKERLIGASILVAFVVLVVPELLSGPKPTTAPAPALPAAAPEPTRSIEVDLTTSRPPASPTAEPVVPDTAASAAAASGVNTPAAESTAASGPAGPAASGPAASGPAPSGSAPSRSASSGAAMSASIRPAIAGPLESSASSPISSASWSVQLGSFASRANAENLTRELKGQGFSVFVLPGGSGSLVRYRVRVGPLADRGSAERMAAKLKSLGHVGSLVAPAA